MKKLLTMITIALIILVAILCAVRQQQRIKKSDIDLPGYSLEEQQWLLESVTRITKKTVGIGKVKGDFDLCFETEKGIGFTKVSYWFNDEKFSETVYTENAVEAIETIATRITQTIVSEISRKVWKVVILTMSFVDVLFFLVIACIPSTAIRSKR